METWAVRYLKLIPRYQDGPLRAYEVFVMLFIRLKYMPEHVHAFKRSLIIDARYASLSSGNVLYALEDEVLEDFHTTAKIPIALCGRCCDWF